MHIYLLPCTYCLLPIENGFGTCEADRPLVVHFCGNDPEVLLRAARLLQNTMEAPYNNFKLRVYVATLKACRVWTVQMTAHKFRILRLGFS